MAPKKKAIWLNYDFGLRGNYNALFTFLDNYNAKDCGNGLAYLEYDNPEQLTSELLIEKLREEINTTVAPSLSDRIYVIWRDDQNSDNKVRGKFLFGKRKAAPWNGYSNKNESKTSDEAI